MKTIKKNLKKIVTFIGVGLFLVGIISCLEIIGQNYVPFIAPGFMLILARLYFGTTMDIYSMEIE